MGWMGRGESSVGGVGEVGNGSAKNRSYNSTLGNLINNEYKKSLLDCPIC